VNISKCVEKIRDEIHLLSNKGTEIHKENMDIFIVAKRFLKTNITCIGLLNFNRKIFGSFME